MPRRLISMALIYDFDGTLAPGNMQEHAFLPDLELAKKSFWAEVGKLAKEKEADEVLVYMKLMLEKANEKKKKIRKDSFVKSGKEIDVFEGVEGWFERIAEYGKSFGVKIEHFIISSGLREFIEGVQKAGKIKKIKKIFASSFMYDQHEVAQWPALAVNYTNKTQYLFRINKGIHDVSENKKLNNYTPEEKRPIPFERMIYIGDSATDIPCFKMVKYKGGHAIAVYKPHARGEGGKKAGQDLIKQGRADFCAPANYSDGQQLDKVVKSIIHKIVADDALKRLR